MKTKAKDEWGDNSGGFGETLRWLKQGEAKVDAQLFLWKIIQ